jgi:hypothetical protein
MGWLFGGLAILGVAAVALLWAALVDTRLTHLENCLRDDVWKMRDAIVALERKQHDETR